ncbi:hypothetical protein phi9181_ORF067 [Enterococcus phage 9181]|nr:hypothetical protein phi9181_ORF067 [Enterococcus phage 9181]
MCVAWSCLDYPINMVGRLVGCPILCHTSRPLLCFRCVSP